MNLHSPSNSLFYNHFPSARFGVPGTRLFTEGLFELFFATSFASPLLIGAAKIFRQRRRRQSFTASSAEALPPKAPTSANRFLLLTPGLGLRASAQNVTTQPALSNPILEAARVFALSCSPFLHLCGKEAGGIGVNNYRRTSLRLCVPFFSRLFSELGTAFDSGLLCFQELLSCVN